MCMTQYDAAGDFDYCFVKYYMRIHNEAYICIENVAGMDMNRRNYTNLPKAYARCKEKFDEKKSIQPTLTAEGFFSVIVPDMQKNLHKLVVESIERNCLTPDIKSRISVRRAVDSAFDKTYKAFEKEYASPDYSPEKYIRLLKALRHLEELL